MDDNSATNRMKVNVIIFPSMLDGISVQSVLRAEPEENSASGRLFRPLFDAQYRVQPIEIKRDNFSAAAKYGTASPTRFAARKGFRRAEVRLCLNTTFRAQGNLESSWREQHG